MSRQTRTTYTCDRCKKTEIEQGAIVSFTVFVSLSVATPDVVSSNDTRDVDLCPRCAASSLYRLFKQQGCDHVIAWLKEIQYPRRDPS